MMHARATRCVPALALGVLLAHPALGQDLTVDPQGLNTGTFVNTLKFGGTEIDYLRCRIPPRPGQPGQPCVPVATQEGIMSARTGGPPIFGQRPPPKNPPNQYGLDLFTANVPRLSITHDGLIGIGTQAPAYSLDVRGERDVQIGLQSTDAGGRSWTVQSSGTRDASLVGTFQIVDRSADKARLIIDVDGNVTIPGNVTASTVRITGGADLAEPFVVGSPYPAGSVLRIDPGHPSQLELSDRAYDRRVAGVVSGAGDIRTALTLAQAERLGTAGASNEAKHVALQNVALSGRVYVLADATRGPIAPGDLLTSSTTPGYCMRVSDYGRARGAILGKAMSSLTRGKGLVLALVTLQ